MVLCIGEWKKRPKVWVYKARSDFCASLSGNTEICSFWAGVLSGSTSPDADSTGSSTEAVAAGVGDGGAEADVSVEFVSELFSEFDKGVDDAEDDAGVIEMLHPDSKQVHNAIETSVYKGYKQDKIEMRGDRAEMSDFPLYLKRHQLRQ